MTLGCAMLTKHSKLYKCCLIKKIYYLKEKKPNLKYLLLKLKLNNVIADVYAGEMFTQKISFNRLKNKMPREERKKYRKKKCSKNSSSKPWLSLQLLTKYCAIFSN